jgi:hypothetical protein
MTRPTHARAWRWSSNTSHSKRYARSISTTRVPTTTRRRIYRVPTRESTTHPVHGLLSRMTCVGSAWALNNGGQETAARVLKVGTKASRVVIRIEDPAMEGHEDWVPPARLKIAWDHVDTFGAEAAEQAAAPLIPEDVAKLSRGYPRVYDVRAVAELAGTNEDIVAHPQGFATPRPAL